MAKQAYSKAPHLSPFSSPSTKKLMPTTQHVHYLTHIFIKAHSCHHRKEPRLGERTMAIKL
jgi:hypothetical protein